MKDDDEEEISEPSESDLLKLQLKSQRKNSKELAEKNQVKAEELSKTARSKLKKQLGFADKKGEKSSKMN